MIRLKRPYQLLLMVLLLFAGLTGCNDSNPAPAPGSMRGVIRPAGAVRAVQTTSNNVNTSATPDPVTGAFTLPDLPPGSYVLGFRPAAGYREPTAQAYTVKSGQTTDAGTVDAVRDGSFRSGSVNWNADGAARAVTDLLGYADATGHRFAFSALSLDLNAPVVTADRLQINLDGVFTGVGDYAIGGAAGSSAVYGRGVSSQSTVTYRSGTASTGTLRVLTYDAEAGTMTGTFSLTLPAETGSGSVSITNGTFSLRF
ncbi:carboxypeptidase-like regulatory domain-containing protein [Hymenobacter sp. 15J16-1T3B]|uniref:carboxypeptidase-like regulatory domain-containing protein n=1 Tax=Hymenobacter sp. 15J16-1T3B TaxID=2886941 RepID=UPI001D104588|nr:carboxypeptidase-like regulatory domain-containing protein [Hymenobacter sp. 15J16-1T3B]MCC3158915.1 carboxypeptidase-like regulatory domain-containing protein [Hymenobacter sp. 15J16-1T3B]